MTGFLPLHRSETVKRLFSCSWHAGKHVLHRRNGNTKIDESVKKKAHIVPENFDDVKDITASRVCFKILTHHINSASICQTIYDKRSK